MGEERNTFRVIENKEDDQMLLVEVDCLEDKDLFKEEELSKVFKIKDEFTRQKAIMSLNDKARKIGKYRELQSILKVVKKKFAVSKASFNDQSYSVYVKELDLEYQTGEWIVDDNGVRRYIERGEQLLEEQASWQFIVISNIYYNTEYNTYRVQLAFKENSFSKLKTITVNKSIITNTSSITCLADYGIAVTNQTAQALIKYLNDLERLNVDTIKRSASISRLGWINDYGFIPYTDDMSFDGETIYGELYNAVESKGSYDEWKAMVLDENSLQARIALATSFAGPLVSIMEGLCFFTHLWGGSGTGKSVSLHLASSVWGNPMKIVQNLNSTSVGLERLAGFFCNVPLCLDELQTLKKSYGHTTYDEMLYKLGQGKGKNRGRKDGSIEKVATWSTSFITTGEEPIITDKSGDGAKNRVLDIYCDGNIFKNAPYVARTSHNNYGFAGREFISKLRDFLVDNTKKPIDELYNKFYQHILDNEVTEKQAMSATMVTLGHCLMKLFIFGEQFDNIEKIGYDFINEIKPMLIKNYELNNADEVYDNLMSYIIQNKHHFIYKSSDGIEHSPVDERIETWGKFVGDMVYLTNTAFNEYCEKNSMSCKKITKMLLEHNYSCLNKDGKITYPIRINGSLIRCLTIFTNRNNVTQNDSLLEIKDSGDLPF